MLICFDGRMIPLASIGYAEDRGSTGRIVLRAEAALGPNDRAITVSQSNWPQVREALAAMQANVAPMPPARRKRVARAVPA